MNAPLVGFALVCLVAQTVVLSANVRRGTSRFVVLTEALFALLWVVFAGVEPLGIESGYPSLWLALAVLVSLSAVSVRRHRRSARNRAT
ncbi:hypothetical protein [Haladaptatus salinisoli]|uniref:hypothetical protein n=1 Tax=Haladaptatus salinisoli TaxID=2884876 RepID=UPI001D0B27A1|nr:hypothetical protein [Haladaptatus salinisoli]